MDTNLTIMQVSALLITDMCHALLGNIKVPLARRRLNIDQARVGGLVSVFGFALIPMAFAASIFSDLLGRNVLIFSGFILLICSILLLATLKDYIVTLLAVLLLGTGWSALVNVLKSTRGPAFLTIENIFSKANFCSP